MQAKDSVKAGPVFKTIVLIALALVLVVGGMNLMKEPVVQEVDLSSIEDRLVAIESMQSEFEAPEMPELNTEDLDAAVSKMEGLDELVNDLVDKAYKEEKDSIEEEGVSAFDAEFDEEDLEEFVEDSIEGFDRLRNVREDEDFGDDGVKITIVNLGLDDDEDKKVIVEKSYKIRYELDDTNDVYKADVVVVGTITYDDDDGFEAELVFSLE